MKKFIAVLLLFVCAYAVNKATVPYSLAPGTPARGSEVKKNDDSIAVPFNRAVDTLNTTVPRWSMLKAGDTLFQKSRIERLQVDSIRSSPNIDSILATPLYIKGRVVCDTFVGNITGIADSAKGTHHLYGGTANADSLNVHGTVIQKNGNVGIGLTNPAYAIDAAGRARFTNNGTSGIYLRDAAATPNIWLLATGIVNNNDGLFSIIDSRQSLNRLTIDINGNVGIGTVYPISPLTVKGNFVDTGNTLITGTLTASGLTTLDSVYTPKGIKAAVFTGNATTATTATNQSGGTVSATTGAFSSTLTADSIYTTKYNNVKKGTFTFNVLGCDAAVTGTASYTMVDNIVQINFPTTTGTSNVDTLTISGIPAAIQTSKECFIPTLVADNGSTFFAIADIYLGVIRMYTISTSTHRLDQHGFTASGSKGTQGTSVTYLK